MASKHKSAPVTLEIKDGVGIVTISNPPVNALAIPVLEGLKVALEAAQRDGAVKAIVITGSKGQFSGGFDIMQLKARSEGKPVPDMSDFNAILASLVESGPKPTVAAIENLALGGGLEVAMACNARVATPGAQLGLPELQLGVIPGFGGTQRLPRLVGLEAALRMMLQSKPIKAEEGHKLGLVDHVVPREGLLAAAIKLALDIADKRAPRVMSFYRADKLPAPAAAKVMLGMARKQAKAVQSVMPHPGLCLDAIEAGLAKGAEEGLLVEQASFAKAVSSTACRGLVHFFFASRGTTSVPGVTDTGLKPRPTKCVGVIGGGLMGSGIATACILSGVSVMLKEINQKFLDAGMDRIKSNLASNVKKGRMTPEKAAQTLALVHPTLTYAEFGKVGMAIEAVIENLELKQRIFADLEAACRPDCILSTNTSTIDITKVAAKMRSPERIVGAHFFSPAHIMPLFEVIRTAATPPQVLVDTLGLSKQIKKTPVVVGNCTGFAVNRVFYPYTMSACLLLDLGCDPYAIDNAIKMFGMPMGPFRLGDLVGHDVGVHVGQNFLDDFPDHVFASQIIPLLVQAKRLGEKSGAGFYVYDAKRKATPDPEGIAGLLEASRAAAADKFPVNVSRGGMGGMGGPVGGPLNALTQNDIVEMIFFPVVNEACRCLAEGVVVRAGDLDVAAILGMGFPAFRGGIVHWADQVGAAHIVAKLREWTTRYGGLYQPCPYLEDCAVQGRKLADGPHPGPDRSKL